MCVETQIDMFLFLSSNFFFLMSVTEQRFLTWLMSISPSCWNLQMLALSWRTERWGCTKGCQKGENSYEDSQALWKSSPWVNSLSRSLRAPNPGRHHWILVYLMMLPRGVQNKAHWLNTSMIPPIEHLLYLIKNPVAIVGKLRMYSWFFEI